MYGISIIIIMLIMYFERVFDEINIIKSLLILIFILFIILFIIQLFAAQPDGLAVQILVADDEIGAFAVGNGADGVQTADLPRRVPCRSADGVLLRNAEGDRAEHTVVEIRGRACDGAVGQPRDAALEEHGLPAQLIFAVGHTAAAQRIGDEDHPSREEPEGHPDCTGVDMDTIADKLRLHPLALAGRADDPGLSVMNRRHGIVQMGQMPGASLKHRQRMLIIRIRVGNGDITQFLSLGGKLHRSRQLRCDVHDLNEAAAALLQLPKRCKIRVLQVSAVLRALFLLAEKRPLHLDAPEGSAARRRFIH